MDYIITFDDGSSAYLEHHGVMGMKWGVRNAETQAKYSGGNGGQVRGNGVAPYARQRRARIGFGGAANAARLSNYVQGEGPAPTRRQVKSALRYNEKQTYKQSGGLFRGSKVAGKESLKVRSKHNEALRKDEQYQNLKKARSEAYDRYSKASSDYYNMKRANERLQSNENASSLQKVIGSTATSVTKYNRNNMSKAYDTAAEATETRRKEIGQTFKKQYEKALIKDLGFKNVDRGREFLEGYGLLDKTSEKYIRKAHDRE